MSIGRPNIEKAMQHPLYGTELAEVPFLNGCEKYHDCFTCEIPIELCPAWHPRLGKGGRRRNRNDTTHLSS